MSDIRFRYSWEIHVAKYLIMASVIGAYLLPPALVVGVGFVVYDLVMSP